MENQVYDVIIIGAGPAGSSCASNLTYLNKNLSVLLLDKQSFPRYKPCGGGISPEVANYLKFSIEEAIDFVCQDISVVADSKRFSHTGDNMWMVRREHFDNYLLEQAKKSGVQVVTSCEVLEVVQQKEHIRVVTAKSTFVGSYVALAEGGHGKLAKKMGLMVKNKLLAAMEYEHYTDRPSPQLEINLDKHVSGYAWQFPKSDGLSIGIGADMKRAPSKKEEGLPNKLMEYMKELGINALNKSQLYGHPILVYNGRSQLVDNRLLLIGEIAGCVDPLTGEGIRPAIKSGYLAARALNDAATGNKPKLLRQYEKQFHQQIGKDLNYARLLVSLKTRYNRSFLRLMSPQRLKTMLAIFTGIDTYRNRVSVKKWFRFILRVGR